MKKRILTSVLVMLLLLGAAGCQTSNTTPGNEASSPVSPSAPVNSAEPSLSVDPAAEEAAAIEAYTRIADKLSMSREAGEDVQFDMDMIMKTNVEFAGESQSIETNGNIKMKIVGEEMHSSMVLDMGAAGKMEMYSDGETAYCSYNGQELEIDMVDVFSQVEDTLNIPQFEKDAIKSSEIIQDGANTKILLVIDGEALQSFMLEIMSSMLGGEADTQGLKFNDIEISMTATDDEIPLSMEISMEMEMEIAGDTVKMSSDVTYIFNAFGSEVEVDLSML